MWIGNLDGLRQGLVIATSKVKARQIIGRCSAHEFDSYWREQDDVDETLAPETLYTRPFTTDRGKGMWFQGRCAVRRSL